MHILYYFFPLEVFVTGGGRRGIFSPPAEQFPQGLKPSGPKTSTARTARRSSRAKAEGLAPLCTVHSARTVRAVEAEMPSMPRSVRSTRSCRKFSACAGSLSSPTPAAALRCSRATKWERRGRCCTRRRTRTCREATTSTRPPSRPPSPALRQRLAQADATPGGDRCLRCRPAL